MDKFDIFQGCKCLYTPKGAAREYAAVGCNFYRGCPYQCQYCYNRKGLTAGVMGIDHAVLEGCFVSRPMYYRTITSEDYARTCFMDEVSHNRPYLQDMGVFFSFSTDPLSVDTWELTMKSAVYAAWYKIPVKILTKNAMYDTVTNPDQEIVRFIEQEIPEYMREMFAFGFTLTGRDDQEPNASTNTARISSMKRLHEMGFKTFASIEPIVDFDSSYRMIKETVGICDQYLIGLMSSRGTEYPPYELKDCVKFIQKVMKLLKKQQHPAKVYWKKSIRKFVKGSRAAMNVVWDEDIFVEAGYSLQYGTVTYPIHTLAAETLPDAVRHLESLMGSSSDKERKRHETSLMRFFYHYQNTNDLIEYAEYLAHHDMEELYELAKKIKEASDRFISVYSREMNEKEEIRPFITKVRKGVDFPPELLFYIARILGRIAQGIVSDVEKHLSKEL